MKVSYQWLCEVVELSDIAPADLARRLTSAGLTVDGVEQRAASMTGVVVGHVVSCEQHPNADRLKVCHVDVGADEMLQIVCGAPNVGAGQKVPVATVGSKLPGGPIGKAKLRGVASQGMLCSAKEIGLETRLLPKEQTEGLFLLPSDAPVGTNAVEYLHLDDVILDIDLTPNRSDCLSIRGLAYEIGALYNRPVKLPTAESPNTGKPGPVQVRLDTPRCSRYDAQVFTGIEDGASPIWMQMRLLTMGVRPISAVVDITNYVMLEWGQPLHAFDFDEVRAGTIVVRQANENESLVTLDGNERRLTEDTIVISDPERAIGIAGVMGGENSEITSRTRRVVLESAAFDASSVRRTGQRLGLRSEAQQRFEKGIDWVAVPSALARATALFGSICGASFEGDPVSVVNTASSDAATPGHGMSMQATRNVVFSPAACRSLLGAEIDDVSMADVFARLGFSVEQGDDVWNVAVPARRPDIERQADLVEEVARFVGYDAIPSTLPVGPTTVGTRNLRQQLQWTTRHVLTSIGLDEVFTYAFTHPSTLDALRIDADSPYRRTIPLALPMSEERSVLRTHLLPSLATVGAHNLARGQAGGQIFEIARVYLPSRLPLTEQPEERLQWAGLWFGEHSAHLGERRRTYDFYDVKGVVESWLESLGLLAEATFERCKRPWLHPGRSASVQVRGEELGTFGEIHPETAKTLDVPGALYGEFSFAETEQVMDLRFRAKALPKFPATLRDLSIVVSEEVETADLIRSAEQTAARVQPGVLETCTLFDVYRGTGIEAGYQSLAFSFVYRAPDRTLTDEEVGQIEQAVLQTWEVEFAAHLRG